MSKYQVYATIIFFLDQGLDIPISFAFFELLHKFASCIVTCCYLLWLQRLVALDAAMVKFYTCDANNFTIDGGSCEFDWNVLRNVQSGSERFTFSYVAISFSRIYIEFTSEFVLLQS